MPESAHPGSPRPGSRGPYASPRQAERQRRILETARREITAVGYDALTMQQLAEASAVSTKTLYNLFGSKDELLLAAVADLLGNLEQHPSVEHARGLDRLLAFTGVVCEQIAATPRYAEVMARALFQAEPGQRLVDVLLGNAVRVNRVALVEAQALGELHADLDVEALARQLTGQQWGLVLMWSKDMLSLEVLPATARRSHVSSLLPLSSAQARDRLQAQY